MARSLSLAIGRHVPSVSFRDVFGGERTTSLSVERPSFSLRDVFATVGATIALIAAAGRVGAAVEAHQAPSAEDLKTAGLEKEDFFRTSYRF